MGERELIVEDHSTNFMFINSTDQSPITFGSTWQSRGTKAVELLRSSKMAQRTRRNPLETVCRAMKS